MADKYSFLAAQAELARTKGAGRRITPGDAITAEVTRFTDYVDLADVSVGDVVRIGPPLPKGSRPNLKQCEITIFGDGGYLNGKFGYMTLDGKVVRDAAYGTAVVSLLSNGGNASQNNVRSFGAVGSTERMPNQAYLIFTVASKQSVLTTSSGIPDTSVRGRAYFDIEYSIFN